jgi:hypothetical protein
MAISGGRTSTRPTSLLEVSVVLYEDAIDEEGPRACKVISDVLALIKSLNSGFEQRVQRPRCHVSIDQIGVLN